jgi:hypothetical protein
MAKRNRCGTNIFLPSFTVLSVFICVSACGGWFQSPSAFAQESRDQEVAVNLAEGRVVICAAKDGMIVAAMNAASEAGSLPPGIAVLSSERAGVMLGAVEWVQPDSKDKPVRLDNEFPKLVAAALNTGGRPGYYSSGASDIESIGVAVLERLRELAGTLHHKIKLGEDEPLVRVVLAGFVRDYGPEVWSLDYHIRQDALGNDLWRTRVLRPSYNQLYPPEKGQPKTLIEIRYPPENRATDAPELLDLLRQNDPRLEKIRSATVAVAKSIELVAGGQSHKSDAASDSDFLKAALPTVNSPDTKLVIALVDFDRGFQWILAPPKAHEPAPAPEESKEKSKAPEEPERPSLLHKPGN